MPRQRSPQTIPLLARLSAGRAQQLLAASAPQRYARGQALFRQGDPADAIWIIQEGWVHLLRTADGEHNARAVAIFTITPAEVLCGLSAVAPGGVCSVSAVAATACRTLRIPAPVFQQALAYDAAFAARVVQLCARRIQSIAQQYGSMAEPVPRRLVRAILRLSDQFGSTIPVTHRELAQMAWTTTESAIRAVRRLKQQGYVSGARGRLAVRRRAELEHLLDGVRGHRTAETRARTAV